MAKFRAVKPKGSNGWWKVVDGRGKEYCVCYYTGAKDRQAGSIERRAKLIAQGLNELTRPSPYTPTKAKEAGK